MIDSNEIIHRLKKKTGRLFSSTAQDESDVYLYINDGVRRLCKDGFWDFNDRIYDVTADGVSTIVDIKEFLTIHGILQDGEKIYQDQDWVYGKDYYMNLDKIGVFASKLYLPALSTSTFRIVYRGFPGKVSASQTLIDVPDYCDKAIELASVMYAYYDINQDDNAGKYANAYKAEVERLRAMITDAVESKKRRMSSKHNW